MYALNLAIQCFYISGAMDLVPVIHFLYVKTIHEIEIEFRNLNIILIRILKMENIQNFCPETSIFDPNFS